MQGNLLEDGKPQVSRLRWQAMYFHIINFYNIGGKGKIQKSSRVQGAGWDWTKEAGDTEWCQTSQSTVEIEVSEALCLKIEGGE